ncbi:MAG TPA: hypothetical protein PKW63_10525 [Vicinamibacterales bacterium]|jgi:hypothetical protein|nr:hypothetical protein [Acidobacteriota bacterium]HQX82184.1 hypothetical protein [Vicinamibacterales bacterium]
MHPVSAVVLSVGEPYTQRAIDSLSRQSLPLDDIIVIEHVSPFSRAINEGAKRVRTPYFVQVDSDMILDPACVETLVAGMRPDTGIMVGELRDALLGQTVGVKLFRTECFRETGVPDSIAQDTDFVARLRARGWRTHYVAAKSADPLALRPTLGEHKPEYTESYTYRKLLVDGARIRHRAAKHGLFWQMGAMEESRHPMAVLAQVAFSHGLFQNLERDELRPVPRDPKCDELVAHLASETRHADIGEGLPALAREGRLGDIFKRFVTAGRSLGRHQAGATFRDVFNGLSGTRRNPRALVAKIALSHGLLMNDTDRDRLPAHERALRDLVVFGLGTRATRWQHIRALAMLAARRDSRAVPW